jgi:hypothetical protein
MVKTACFIAQYTRKIGGNDSLYLSKKYCPCLSAPGEAKEDRTIEKDRYTVIA